MNSQSCSAGNTAPTKRLPNLGVPLIVLDRDEVAASLWQEFPYLVICNAAIHDDGAARAVLAEARFDPAVCDGHYAANPTIPFVDMARAMDQVAALLAKRPGAVPLLARISSMRAESMETAAADEVYLIWAEFQRDRLVTRLYSKSDAKLRATIQGWEYDHACKPRLARVPGHAQRAEPGIVEGEIDWTERIGPYRILGLIPQTPPFLVLKSGRRGRTAKGADVVQTISRIRTEQAAGHIMGQSVLGPMHYSRSLAQSGMLLAVLANGGANAVPEVVSGKSIWHDTREYFAPDVEITTTVVCNRVFTRGGSTFVNVHGHVEVQGKAVLATEGFTYILVPTDKHPATRKPLE